ncbi:MAG TPA: TauD/TfdA family dioxygenase [Jatrophihabitans sp.]|nr:TauD/TfdA family dioxygenase [Jatrophihabitans sp.]
MNTEQALAWIQDTGKPATLQLDELRDIPAACDWLEQVRSQLRSALDEYGAIFLRGLPVASVEDVAQLRNVLIPERTPYREKATPRSDLGHDVFSSTDLPPSQSISMHNENSYTLTFPGLLMFACLVAPAEGGATPVADCRKVLAALPPALVERMRAHGWSLTRTYSENISTDWRTAFAADSPAEVEAYCEANLISCRWDGDDGLRTRQVRPGVIHHPRTSEAVWFNHLAFWNAWALDPEIRETLVDEFGWDNLPFNTAIADGAPLTEDELHCIDDAYAAATVRQRWQPGDVMLVDNILSTHGRDPFRGARKIVVAMGQPVDLLDCSPTVQPAA